MRERLKGFYQKRMTFDRAFQYGERFRYGALNAGGLGLSVYAPYCAVLSPDFSNALDQIACLPGDSLDICFARAGKFDHIDLEKSVGPYSHRHWMVTSQRIGEIDSTPKHYWQQLLVSLDFKRYFEIIFIGDVSLKDLYCVRIPAAEYQAMWELAFANYGRKLSEAERAWVQDFIQLIRASKDGKIQVEVIT